MMNVFAAILVSGTLAMADGPAADTEDPGQLQPTEEKTVKVLTPEVDVIDEDAFNAPTLEGNVWKPSIVSINSRVGQEFEAMIDERAHFKNELRRAIDRL